MTPRANIQAEAIMEALEVEPSLRSARPVALSIMLVDDDPDMHVMLRQLLEPAGYVMISCVDGAAGLDRLRSGPEPDIIVLDLRMPTMNGWEFRIAQKRNARWASIPVIALSGDSSPQAEAIDAEAYLPKPVEPRSLLDTLQRVGRALQRSRVVARASELQRLVSLGTLVGGIAHEINNPLTFIADDVQKVQRRLASWKDSTTLSAEDRYAASRALDRMRIGLDRIAAVVGSVSLFAFSDSDAAEPTDVHRVLEASLQVAFNELRHAAHVVRSYQPVPPVLANPARLGQVFLNLLLNAVTAVRERDDGPHSIHVQSEARGELVVVTVSDSASTLAGAGDLHVFDPLAGEPVAGRMGLRFSLAVSRELIEAIGGSIELEQNEPTGSRVRVLLPSCSRASRPPPALTPLPASGWRARVLVIDDDELVCELFEAILEDQYEVSAFTSPLAAASALVEQDFDVVLCDVMMPELDGLGLYERAIRLRPELHERFVFVTGGVFTERVRNGLRQTGRVIIQKPCDRDTLLAAVAAQVAARRAAVSMA